ncbi:MAG: phosphoadenylyl-sulfate reductase [Deltaproteobacteria bacterium]|nr:phosphoadenylyl-sulfate reductase [Deltaproteobacteria bacterium]
MSALGDAADLAPFIRQYFPRIAIASSFSLEDALVMAWGVEVEPSVRVIALDTGRLPEETFEVAEALRQRLGVRIEWFAPNTGQVERLERDKGLYSFRSSLAERHECCRIRKVDPLRRALVGVDAWVTGQRRLHGVTRSKLEVVETPATGPIKINPLAHWTLEEVRREVARRGLPYHRLYDRGFTSIGCAPCTRAVAAGEDERAGRWWWEGAEHKECGLHNRQGEAK